ncbi:MAG: RNA polymerase sigma-70 factor [Ignavibacteria bacterium]|jgi:RNA polymerase sigma-70 factor (ECF subfamily)
MRNGFDKKLIDELKQGSTDALRKVHELFKKKLFCFVYSYTRNAEISEELVQDVFIRIWKNRQTLDPASSINNYIYTIAKNLTIDYLRKKKGEVISLESVKENEISSGHEGELKIISREDEATVNKVIDKLSQRKKEVFKMHRFEQMTYREIAVKLDVSLSAVEKNISSALREIRESLAEKDLW